MQAHVGERRIEELVACTFFVYASLAARFALDILHMRSLYTPVLNRRMRYLARLDTLGYSSASTIFAAQRSLQCHLRATTPTGAVARK